MFKSYDYETPLPFAKAIGQLLLEKDRARPVIEAVLRMHQLSAKRGVAFAFADFCNMLDNIVDADARRRNGNVQKCIKDAKDLLLKSPQEAALGEVPALEERYARCRRYMDFDAAVLAYFFYQKEDKWGYKSYRNSLYRNTVVCVGELHSNSAQLFFYPRESLFGVHVYKSSYEPSCIPRTENGAAAVQLDKWKEFIDFVLSPVREWCSWDRETKEERRLKTIDEFEKLYESNPLRASLLAMSFQILRPGGGGMINMDAFFACIEVIWARDPQFVIRNVRAIAENGSYHLLNMLLCDRSNPATKQKIRQEARVLRPSCDNDYDDDNDSDSDTKDDEEEPLQTRFVKRTVTQHCEKYSHQGRSERLKKGVDHRSSYRPGVMQQKLIDAQPWQRMQCEELEKQGQLAINLSQQRRLQRCERKLAVAREFLAWLRNGKVLPFFSGDDGVAASNPFSDTFVGKVYEISIDEIISEVMEEKTNLKEKIYKVFEITRVPRNPAIAKLWDEFPPIYERILKEEAERLEANRLANLDEQELWKISAPEEYEWAMQTKAIIFADNGDDAWDLVDEEEEVEQAIICTLLTSNVMQGLSMAGKMTRPGELKLMKEVQELEAAVIKSGDNASPEQRKELATKLWYLEFVQVRNLKLSPSEIKKLIKKDPKWQKLLDQLERRIERNAARTAAFKKSRNVVDLLYSMRVAFVEWLQNSLTEGALEAVLGDPVQQMDIEGVCEKKRSRLHLTVDDLFVARRTDNVLKTVVATTAPAMNPLANFKVKESLQPLYRKFIEERDMRYRLADKQRSKDNVAKGRNLAARKDPRVVALFDAVVEEYARALSANDRNAWKWVPTHGSCTDKGTGFANGIAAAIQRAIGGPRKEDDPHGRYLKSRKSDENLRNGVPEALIGKGQGKQILQLDNCSTGHVKCYAENYHKKHNPDAYDRLMNGDPLNVRVNCSGLSLLELAKLLVDGENPVAERLLLAAAANMKLPEDMVIIPLADLSGSMSGDPMLLAMVIAVLLALANYRRTDEVLGGVWINFDTQTYFYRIPDLLGKDKGKFTLREIFLSMLKKPWGGSTDFNGAMRGVLHLLKTMEGGPINKACVWCITDMQFDAADGGGAYKTNVEIVMSEYEEEGMQMPLLVLHNARGDCDSGVAPVEASQKGVICMSGYNVEMLKEILRMLNTGDIKVPEAKADAQEPVIEMDRRMQLSTDGVLEELFARPIYAKYKFDLATVLTVEKNKRQC